MNAFCHLPPATWQWPPNSTLFRRFVVLLGFTFALAGAHADQVQMQNGDRYTGKVVSVNADTVVLENDLLGTLKLPRAKVGTVAFGAVPAGGTNALRTIPRTNAPLVRTLSSNAAPDLAAALRQLGTNNTATGELDHTKLLDAAGPEARNKFNELLGGLMTGRLTVSDIRAQAKAVAEQARALRSDLGEDGASVLDGYLAILDKFLGEAAPEGKQAAPVPAKPASGRNP